MSVIFSDAFTRANSTSLGTSWNEFAANPSGGWQIVSNQLQGPSTNQPANSHVCETTTTAFAARTNMRVKFTRVAGTSWDGGPGALKQSGADTCYYLDVLSSTTAQIYRRTAATDVTVGSAISSTFANTDTYELSTSVSGGTTTIKAYKNGTQIGSTQTDSGITAAGFAAIVIWSGTVTVDDFSVDDMGGNAYTLTAAAGSFALTGVAASLKAGHVLTAAAGSYALTGKAASLVRGYTLTAAKGTFTLTGQSAALVRGYTLAAAKGTFVLTGQAAALTSARRLTAAAGSFVLTGQAAILKAGRVLSASAGAYAVGGQDANLHKTGSYTLSLARGDFAVAGVAASLKPARRLSAAAGAYVLTGTAATLTSSGSTTTSAYLYRYTQFWLRRR